MKVGLLWFDDDPGRDLAEKVGRAARRYRQKFGVPADVCYVHPSTLGDDASLRQGSVQATKFSASGRMKKVDGVRVSSKPSVLRHHFWIGQEEKR
jgi:hypothetical protein